MKMQRKIRWSRSIILFSALILVASLASWGVGHVSLMAEAAGYKRDLISLVNEAEGVLLSYTDLKYEKNLSVTNSAVLQQRAKEDLENYIKVVNQVLESPLTAQTYQQVKSLYSPAPDYQRVLNNLKFYTDEQISDFLSDPSRLPYLAHLPSQGDWQTPPSTVASSLEAIPYVYQWDPSWAYLSYRNSTLAKEGSLPCSLSMAISWLVQDNTITPSVLAQLLDAPLSNEEYTQLGHPDDEARIQDIFKKYSINAAPFEVNSELLQQNLDQGKLILASQIDSSGSHWVLIVKTADSIRVLDPNSKSNSKIDYTLEDLVNTSQQFIGLSS